jgi:hypothetical protein
MGTRWTGPLPRHLDHGTEVAVQTGSVGTGTTRAWAGHWQLGKTIATSPAIRLIGEYNYASKFFDNLYPTAHDKYGLADQVGWRNIHHIRFGGEVTLAKGWQVTGSGHSWRLADIHEGLYNAAGALIARFPGTPVTGHVGEEIDVQVFHALSAQISLAAGFSRIFPGAFLERATPGANYSFPYLMVTYIFLADK